MSEAADQAEREVEDFFNEEIFGAKPPVENEAPFPQVPESKPVDEVVVETEPETTETPAEDELLTEEPTPEVPPTEPQEPASADEDTATEEEAPPPSDEPAEDEYVAWAKKQYGDDLDLENPQVSKLARAAWEKEKLLGKKAAEAATLQREREEAELQARIDALNTPGNLTPEEDAWVNESLSSNDPGEWAYNALQAQRPDLYASIMDRWSSLGEDEARRARVFHSRVLQAVAAPQPDAQETYTQALGETFVSLGLNIERDGPRILQKAEELGTAHPSVQGMMSTDPDIRRIATRSIYDLIGQANTVVQKAKTDDVVADRVKEEQLRQNAAGIQTGGQRVEQPKKSPFWEQFDAEIEERGWDGNRPSYGRDE